LNIATVSKERGQMRRRGLRDSFFVMCLLVGLVCLTLPGQSKAEKTYEGRTFREWESQLRDPSEAGRVEAVLAMTKLPPGESVLALIRVLQEDPSPRVREEAVLALRRIRQTVGRAIPALERAIKDPSPNVRYAVALALARERKLAEIPDADLSHGDTFPVARSGPENMPVLIDGLKDSDARVRQGTAKILARLGPAAKAAVPELLDALQDPSFGVQQAAADAITQIGPEAVPALLEALTVPKANVRESAAWALGLIGPAAQDAVPHLRGLSTNDPSPHVARAAEQALIKIQSR
jgi:HEAT repeat protein